MKVVVTGGAGFIGSHICEGLLRQGHEVVVVDDLSSGKIEHVPKQATFACVDIRDPDNLGRLMYDVRPDAVCHQAAQISVSASVRQPMNDLQINLIGTLNLLECMRQVEVSKIVFASTGGAIYGQVDEDQKASVEFMPRPQSPYAVSKLAVEGYLRAYACEYGFTPIVLRYSNVYGPRQDPHGEAGVVAIFYQRLLQDQAVQINARKERGDLGCIRDYVYVGDVVRANLAALEGKLEDSTGDIPILNVCTGVGTSTETLLKEIGDTLGGLDWDKVSREPRRSGDIESSILDQSDYVSQLGPCTSLSEGLGVTAQWFRDQAREARGVGSN